MSQIGEQRNEGLQVGRAFAALSVTYFHSYIALRYFPPADVHPFAPLADAGFFGVNLFFAISGYVISVVTDRQRFSTAPFLVKRFFRIYPLVVVFCLFQLFLHSASIVDVTADHSWRRILYAMTLLPGSGERYYAVTWTLEHEIIFYVMAALIVPFFGRGGLTALLAVLAIIAWVTSAGPGHLFTMVQADFLAGMIVYQYRSRLTWCRTAIPLALSLVLYWLSLRGNLWPTPFASFFGLLGFSNMRMNWLRPFWRGVTLVGDASYSIYLSHWILLYLSNRIAWGLQPAGWAAELWRFGTIVAISCVSVALWVGFEKPINAFGHRLAHKLSHRHRRVINKLNSTRVITSSASAARKVPPD